MRISIDAISLILFTYSYYVSMQSFLIQKISIKKSKFPYKWVLKLKD
jgi:hypothetical protein